MKRLKQTIAQIQSLEPGSDGELTSLLWQYICYSPKMPVRFQQQQLLDNAETSSLTVNDEYFEKRKLNFNVFKWGSGKHKILLTHGWGSKALDFSEMITALGDTGDFEIISFDAPGNGSSEGNLSNLLLYVQAVKAVIAKYGDPDVLIGHSLGAMANIMAIKQLAIKPALLVSLTPLVRLKENFEFSMDAIGIPSSAQAEYLNSFNDKFGVPASDFTLSKWYYDDNTLNHWLVYDVNDALLPYAYLEDFAKPRPGIRLKNYAGAGHAQIIKSTVVINDLMNEIRAAVA